MQKLPIINKDKLIDKVINQIDIDMQNEDLTAIYELLMHIDNEVLLSFLEED